MVHRLLSQNSSRTLLCGGDLHPINHTFLGSECSPPHPNEAQDCCDLRNSWIPRVRVSSCEFTDRGVNRTWSETYGSGAEAADIGARVEALAAGDEQHLLVDRDAVGEEDGLLQLQHPVCGNNTDADSGIIPPSSTT